LKGPMATQSLRGMIGQGPLHWRGDRTAGRNGGNALDSMGAFREFNVAFVGLLGRSTELTTEEMNSFTNFIMQVTYPPNPNRPLNNILTTRQQAGNNFFRTQLSTAGFLTCNQCHIVDPANLHFGSSGLMSFEAETQVFKIAHLRNMYQKVGMFGMPSNNSIVPGDNVFMGDQIRGFGFLHDGSVDSLFRFHGAPLFNFPGGTNQRRDVEQFMHAMDTNLPPIMGQQITLNDVNGSSVMTRINLLIQRAAAGEIDLVVKGNIAGKQRGWLRKADSSFQPDDAAEFNLTQTQLLALAQTANQALTFTAVPVDSGQRIALDRDEDGVLDFNDVCPAIADAAQLDSDADGIGNACDNCTAVANASQRDSNGDGYGNMCDADFNNDRIVNALDLGLFKQTFFTFGDIDSDLNGDGVVNSLDLGLFRALFLKQPGPSALVP
jgi:Thrombospondin type 3 repeat